MKEMGDRNPTSSKTRNRLAALEQDRSRQLRNLQDLYLKLLLADEALEKIEEEIVQLYNESDASLREVASVLELDLSTVSRRAKKQREAVR